MSLALGLERIPWPQAEAEQILSEGTVAELGHSVRLMTLVAKSRETLEERGYCEGQNAELLTC